MSRDRYGLPRGVPDWALWLFCLLLLTVGSAPLALWFYIYVFN